MTLSRTTIWTLSGLCVAGVLWSTYRSLHHDRVFIDLSSGSTLAGLVGFEAPAPDLRSLNVNGLLELQLTKTRVLKMQTDTLVAHVFEGRVNSLVIVGLPVAYSAATGELSSICKQLEIDPGNADQAWSPIGILERQLSVGLPPGTIDLAVTTVPHRLTLNMANATPGTSLCYKIIVYW